MPAPLFDHLCAIADRLEAIRNLILHHGAMWYALDTLLTDLDAAIDTLVAPREDKTPARVAAREASDAEHRRPTACPPGPARGHRL